MQALIGNEIAKNIPKNMHIQAIDSRVQIEAEHGISLTTGSKYIPIGIPEFRNHVFYLVVSKDGGFFRSNCMLDLTG